MTARIAAMVNEDAARMCALPPFWAFMLEVLGFGRAR